jgi:STE24 endopeptidase
VEAIDIAAALLKLRVLDPRVPIEFADVFDAESYQRSRECTRARTRLGIAGAIFDLSA